MHHKKADEKKEKKQGRTIKQESLKNGWKSYTFALQDKERREKIVKEVTEAIIKF